VDRDVVEITGPGAALFAVGLGVIWVRGAVYVFVLLPELHCCSARAGGMAAWP
jgi:hypothetical protein